MAQYLVIQILPTSPVSGEQFTQYLSPGLGNLQIAAYALNYGNPSGTNPATPIATAVYTPSNPPPSEAPQPLLPPPTVTPPTYPHGLVNAIVQKYVMTPQVNLPPPGASAYYTPEAVATAVIEVNSPNTFENIRLVAQWGSGPNAQSVPVPFNYYDVTLTPNYGGPPDPNQFGLLPVSIDLQIPAPPGANGTSFTLPTDGSTPAFDQLLSAVKAILGTDPGGPGGPGTAFPVSELGTLTLAQCRNLAYELVWSQQGSLPQSPDPSIEDLYTNPPNNGVLVTASGNSNPTLNQNESNRQQFESSLKGYYSTANAAADRLTNYVFALATAVACEQQSLAATQAALMFPLTPGQPGSGPAVNLQVVMTGLGNATTQNFGVPAAYFYALAALMPTQISSAQRYQQATTETLQRLLTDFTSAISAGTIQDGESYVTQGGSINAAQAARRLAALGGSNSTQAQLAPLGSVELNTNQVSQVVNSATELIFAATSGVQSQMSVTGSNVPANTTVSSQPSSTSVRLSASISTVPVGATIVFTPKYDSQEEDLLKRWLNYPANNSGTLPTSATYQPSDDATNLWPVLAAADSSAFLDLVLCALTQGYIIPAPFNGALGLKITDSSTLQVSSVNDLMAVTAQQWSTFFAANPTWLPPFTQPGNTTEQIDAFIRYLQTFFDVASDNPPNTITLVTSAGQPNPTELTFVSATGVTKGMSVSGASNSTPIPAGTTVTGVTTTTVAGVTTTTVTLSRQTGAIAAQTTIVFQPNYTASAGSSPLQLLSLPTSDAITQCVNAYSAAYGPFTFGNGFDVGKLQAIVAGILSGDTAGQAWLVSALLTIDGLYQVLTPLATANSSLFTPQFVFSLAEALYARGFTSAAQITEHPLADFQQALTGTVAYSYAKKIHNSAVQIVPSPAPSPASPNGFEPVNPDGTLTNCIPPECLSPLGPVAYLSEMLQVSAGSTCETPRGLGITLPTSKDTPSGNTLPFASTAGVIVGMPVSGTNIQNGTNVKSVGPVYVILSATVAGDVPANASITFSPAPDTLGSVIAQRRGPLADLSATNANLETPLPLIDFVNECLEFMASTVPCKTSGTVYDTPADKWAGYALCKDKCGCEEGKPQTASCYEPDRIFAALPAYSTPATPEGAYQNVEPAAFNNLEIDFSSCCLPYSQALDVNRTYLRHFGTCRYEVMRTFRRCITEFVLDPLNEPTGFPDHLWRYPVRLDTAIEYLGITPEEFVLLFGGRKQWPLPCGQNGGFNPSGPRTNDPAIHVNPFGLSSSEGGDSSSWTTTVIQLPTFLELTCLTYCEFLELWHSGYVPFSNGASPRKEGDRGGDFPPCEPCCLEKLWLSFPADPGTETGLIQLGVFVRLWRKLKDVCGARYSFNELRDICEVLQLFTGAQINPCFIRQLAAFQMFRDLFRLELANPASAPAAGTTGAKRSHLLALWVGPAAGEWTWAVNQMIKGIERYAISHHRCDSQAPEFVKLLQSNLDPLSRLAGFDPTSTTYAWWSAPTHTLRFAEVLAKIYASDFGIGEILYLFTVADHLDGDDPFPLQIENDSLDDPLALPDEQPQHSLEELQKKLLDVQLPDEEISAWNWKRIVTALRDELGFVESSVLDMGEHFFPSVLEHAGYQVDSAAARFTSPLAAATPTMPGGTSASMWNTPPDGPFQYAPNGGNLWTQLPLTDEAVISKLSRVHALSPQEQAAVQDLYFQPRKMLATFALVFTDFTAAQKRLIEETEEEKRWAYFQRQFALCHKRCKILAEHLAGHVAFATEKKFPDGTPTAMLILSKLYADENAASAGSWESPQGTTPAVMWTRPGAASAFAALLGLTGTGLMGEYTVQGNVVWRGVTGPLSVFGQTLNGKNCPAPTVVPSMSLTLDPAQLQFVSPRNGFAVKDSTGELLGGAQGFAVKWCGSLLIGHEGNYELSGGAPTPENEKPDWEKAGQRQWKVTLKRGQRTWIVSRRHWPGEQDLHFSSVPLKPGAYELVIEFVEPAPDFTSNSACRAETGFQLKYSGPDTHEKTVEIPHSRLFLISKQQPLGAGITSASPTAAAFLNNYYVSSLRDIRRTYQRAFKALLFAHRFDLSTKQGSDKQSELAYMLQQKANFAGAGYSLAAAGGGSSPSPSFNQQLAGFDFNFLPLLDDYHPPTNAEDSRVAPTPQQIQATFDWWERIFDYARVRKNVHQTCERHLWYLFDEAFEKNPTQPGFLLRHLCADSRHWAADLTYFTSQGAAPYQVTATDLQDERWAVRAWHADRWLVALLLRFHAKDITAALPCLWASDDPSGQVNSAGSTGNANLQVFLYDGCLANGEPRRYEEIRSLNDALRERGRKALLAYLCRNRVALPWAPTQYATSPKALSDILLLDVQAGLEEKASRIDEAISAVQNFVRRARLQLEPTWTVTPEFIRLWDRQFASFHVWKACKRRHLYKENYIEWAELEKAREIETFRFLQSQLTSSALSVAVPGGLNWWPGQRPPAHPGIEILQDKEPSGLLKLTPQREGLSLLGTPEADARSSWLTAIQSKTRESDASSQGAAQASLPLWMEAAIRLGTRFYRIAASGVPSAAATGYKPYAKAHSAADCVPFCTECGCHHPPHLDEYYFWLVDATYYQPPKPNSNYTTTSPDDYQYGYQDDYYDPSQQQSTYWQNESQLPQLLAWPASSMVRLAWCRAHNGQFLQPRKSVKGVPVSSVQGADLTFLGRSADSLLFSVQQALPAPEGYLDTSAPGFRYDMAGDNAVVLPQVTPAPQPPTQPGGLAAYPYFVYFAPGTRLIPLSPFSPALAVASALRCHCRFEAALAWYRLAFDPLKQDCTWIRCPKDKSSQGSEESFGIAAIATNEPSTGTACCDSTSIPCSLARSRAIVLEYVDTLLEWGNAEMRRNSPEAFQHARLIYDSAAQILGKRPVAVLLREPTTPQKVGGLQPYFAALNPRLLDLYTAVENRLGMVHASVNARRLRNGRPREDMPYFSGASEREHGRAHPEPCCEEEAWCHLPSPYRFAYLIQKAQEHASKVTAFGAELLAAFEKGDAEYLASLRAGHERELATLALESRKDQWRDADWQIEALQKTKAADQASLKYYNTLIQNGLISPEIAYQTFTGISMATRAASDISEGISEGMNFTPNTFTGVAGFGGSPLFYEQLPIGTPLAAAFSTAARIMNSLAEVATSNAGLSLTNAGWQRRSDDWVHQAQLLTIQIEQMEQQILGAQRRRSQALHDLNSQNRQIEQSREVQDFLRDKFTAHDLYLFLQKETARLYDRMSELAIAAARQAERAFNLERGHTSLRFVPEHTCDNLHEDLLLGERLEVALRQMEKAYQDRNVREFELTKHFSLRLHFPMEFLRLRITGHCEVELPEWMFDLDYPGHYLRRIKNVTMTIPCVAGPYNGVHCRLTLLSSRTRIDPDLVPPATKCCDCHCPGNAYTACPHDPRILRQYAAREAIATSSGQNDSGLFELNFRDERYLPFEYQGAVSRWRIELPRENNYFDMDTLSDLVLHLNYTAREGGEALRHAASPVAQRNLPGDGWSFIDVRHEMADAWELFRTTPPDERGYRQLTLGFRRNLFPWIPGHQKVSIGKLILFFETSASSHLSPPLPSPCACPDHRPTACFEVRLAHPHEHKAAACETNGNAIHCTANENWQNLYQGFAETHLGPLPGGSDRHALGLQFPEHAGEIARVYLFCHYSV